VRESESVSSQTAYYSSPSIYPHCHRQGHAIAPTSVQACRSHSSVVARRRRLLLHSVSSTEQTCVVTSLWTSALAQIRSESCRNQTDPVDCASCHSRMVGPLSGWCCSDLYRCFIIFIYTIYNERIQRKKIATSSFFRVARHVPRLVTRHVSPTSSQTHLSLSLQSPACLFISSSRGHFQSRPTVPRWVVDRDRRPLPGKHRVE